MTRDQLVAPFCDCFEGGNPETLAEKPASGKAGREREERVEAPTDNPRRLNQEGHVGTAWAVLFPQDVSCFLALIGEKSNVRTGLPYSR